MEPYLIGLIASLRGIFFDKMCSGVFEQDLITYIIDRIFVSRGASI